MLEADMRCFPSRRCLRAGSARLKSDPNGGRRRRHIDCDFVASALCHMYLPVPDAAGSPSRIGTTPILACQRNRVLVGSAEMDARRRVAAGAGDIFEPLLGLAPKAANNIRIAGSDVVLFVCIGREVVKFLAIDELVLLSTGGAGAEKLRNVSPMPLREQSPVRPRGSLVAEQRRQAASVELWKGWPADAA